MSSCTDIYAIDLVPDEIDKAMDMMEITRKVVQELVPLPVVMV